MQRASPRYRNRHRFGWLVPGGAAAHHGWRLRRQPALSHRSDRERLRANRTATVPSRRKRPGTVSGLHPAGGDAGCQDALASARRRQSSVIRIARTEGAAGRADTSRQEDGSAEPSMSRRAPRASMAGPNRWPGHAPVHGSTSVEIVHIWASWGCGRRLLLDIRLLGIGRTLPDGPQHLLTGRE